jgi:hypothetical protein
MAGSSPTTPVVASPLAPRVWLIWLVVAVGIAALTVLVAARATVPNQGFADAAEILALISLVAVGIERVIEVFWTVVSRLRSSWWPINEIADAVDQLVRDTNTVAQPAFDAAIAGLVAARAATDLTKEQIEALDEQIRKVKAQAEEYGEQIKRISRLAKDNQRVQLLATAAFQAANRLDTAYGSTMPAVRQAFNDASQVTAGVADILAGFKDNPAKKVISIVIGWALGLLVAGFVGLDLFAAAGAPLGAAAAPGQAPPLFPFLGVALTGFVIGLGANPTHEVIRLVTEAAKGRRASNLARPTVLAAPDDDDEKVLERPRGAGTKRESKLEHRIVDRLSGSTARAPSRVAPGSMNLRS